MSTSSINVLAQTAISVQRRSWEVSGKARRLLLPSAPRQAVWTGLSWDTLRYMSGYNLYVTGSYLAHNEEQMPKQDDGHPADEQDGAFDHELEKKPQAFFPAEDGEGE